MLDLNETLSKGEHIFNSFVDEIEKDKISDISIRRALKKYDVKNLKINNVTPLRAKKMYSAIIPKYQQGVTTDKYWLENERRLFVWSTLCYIFKKSIQLEDLKTNDFYFLNSMFPLKEIELIKFQVYSLLKKDSKNCKWSQDEDNLLRTIVDKQQSANIEWSNISKVFFSLSSQKYFRNAKQCRQRWLNHLDPTKSKARWEPKQDRILLQQVLEKGKKWSKIVDALEGKKNEHMIKNRFKSLVHKKEKQVKNKKIKQNDLIKLILKDIQEMKSDIQNSEESQEIRSSENNSECIQQNERIQSSELSRNRSNHSKIMQNNERLPIIVQSNSNKNIDKQDEKKDKKLEGQQQQDNQIEVELCGNKVDKQFVNSLFFNVNTPVADDRIQSMNLDSQSPSNIFMSPFHGGCWTPTIFILDDSHSQISPSITLLDDFSMVSKNVENQFLGADNEKQN